MKIILENINRLEVDMLLYNCDFGNYKVFELNKEKCEFEIVIIDNNPTNWYEIINERNSNGVLDIFNGNWYIVDVEQ